MELTPRSAVAAIIVPVAFALALSACAERFGGWVKEGADDRAVAAATNACLQDVEREFSRFEDYCPPVGGGCTASERMLNMEIRKQDIFDRCMQARGFRRTRLGPATDR